MNVGIPKTTGKQRQEDLKPQEKQRQEDLEIFQENIERQE